MEGGPTIRAGSAGAQRDGGAWWLAALIAAFLLLCWPVILTGRGGTSEAWDQDNHHVHVIERFSGVLRGADGAGGLRAALADYPSATSPGMHLAIASVDAAGVHGRVGQRLVASLAGAALLAVLWMALRRVVDPPTATCLCLPLLASPYFLSGSIWLTTDVPALLWVAVSVASLLVRPLSAGWILAAGFAAALAVFVRQPSIWLVAPIGLAATVVAAGQHGRTRLGTACAGLVAALMPCIVLAALVSLWGGLVPPSYRAQHDAGLNAALPAIALALVGLWGIPWLLWNGSSRRTTCLVAAVCAVLLAAIAPSDFSREAGRWGGPIWTLVERTPAVGGRSVLVVLGAGCGGAVLAALGTMPLASRASGWRVTIGCAGVALVAALTANSQAWERYVDLPLLVLLPLAAAAVEGERTAGRKSTLRAPFLLLALAQLLMSVVMVYLPVLRTATATGG